MQLYLSLFSDVLHYFRSIDSRCCITKIESSIDCTVIYQGFISCDYVVISSLKGYMQEHTRTHLHTDMSVVGQHVLVK